MHPVQQVLVMNDHAKFRTTIIAATILIIAVLAYSVVQDLVLPDVEGYVQRRSYYERTLSQKGLSEHKAMYWKEKP